MRPFFAFLVSLLVLSGCGYHLTGKAGDMPGGVESLSIPVFTNVTLKPDIEAGVTAAFVNEFLTTVSIAEDAPFVMEGSITSYNIAPVSYSKSDVVQEYRLTVVMDLRIQKRATGEIVWQAGGVADSEDFTVNTGSPSETSDREEAALLKLARDTARLVKERMLVRF
ncbi:MAG: hypothetical protein H3C68_02440 [Deltaproteobacteria bacterium]|nr:hypothetical protein [Deltaproteobacteria bacterium]MBZ0218884.1 hypothetical protein [Deltaproteobacteria bacterium]